MKKNPKTKFKGAYLSDEWTNLAQISNEIAKRLQTRGSPIPGGYLVTC